MFLFYGTSDWKVSSNRPGPPRRTRRRDLLGGVVRLASSSPHGGTMANPSSYRIAHACCEHRMAALRFNFRGVGKSLGG